MVLTIISINTHAASAVPTSTTAKGHEGEMTIDTAPLPLQLTACRRSSRRCHTQECTPSCSRRDTGSLRGPASGGFGPGVVYLARVVAEGLAAPGVNVVPAPER